ncbi:hypothetical protein LTR95_006613 [Oleoguttula sp. CCFEE 5521]
MKSALKSPASPTRPTISPPTPLRKFEISDSKLEHNNWRFPSPIRLKPLRELDDEDFLTHHKIDRSYDSSTVRFKLLVADPPLTRSNDEIPPYPLPAAVEEILERQRWISDEYEHLWQRDSGGSTTLLAHGVLTFLLQTPRDGGSFCSLSLVNRERNHCGGLYVADETYAIDGLLEDVVYLNRHPKVPRDFAVLPFQILTRHVDETLRQVQKLSRDITATELRLLEGEIDLEENGDYKVLNKFNLEHLRLQRRSNFELELEQNLVKYMNEYHSMWAVLWEGGTSYIEDMHDKIEQQVRYSQQVKLDLEMIPRRIKNQSKTASEPLIMSITNFIMQRDNKLNIELAHSSRKIAEESRRDNLLNIEIAKATAQVAEETRQDSAAMKTIAVLTLTFLPGTAIASFFSMNNAFNFDPGPDEKMVAPYLWIFFAVTVPITVGVYIFWVWWFRTTQGRYKQRHEEGLKDVEKELKMRMRTATAMTW